MLYDENELWRNYINMTSKMKRKTDSSLRGTTLNIKTKISPAGMNRL